ncbi:unnamed protein product [Callosobruchus maculatus]|uniref:Uncharacterized protein n=1 Tax=Callosobruchus maculatus TaxID=64391 RepID=A0A653DED4_CALMS|nr:unnamed protein product [Callosobruchus maculatus]
MPTRIVLKKLNTIRQKSRDLRLATPCWIYMNNEKQSSEESQCLQGLHIPMDTNTKGCSEGCSTRNLPKPTPSSPQKSNFHTPHLSIVIATKCTSFSSFVLFCDIFRDVYYILLDALFRNHLESRKICYTLCTSKTNAVKCSGILPE